MIQKLAFGSGLELFISRDDTKNGMPQFKSSFDFATLTVNRNPGVVNPTPKNTTDVAQTSENMLELPKGKKIETDPAVIEKMNKNFRKRKKYFEKHHPELASKYKKEADERIQSIRPSESVL